ncbi:MAG: YdeI/OmpD-associated family protein [bacterium]|nr:YdeI/OmpD-associated family protein [Candidatus Kapabacteria bacterium]
MAKKDPRIDKYIDKSAEFAQPILNHIRDIVHAACPDVEETMKWSFPHFDYKGEMMCSMASFKGHCAFGFWKGTLILGDDKDGSAMGQFGRITSVKELPAKREMTSYIKKAMKLNDEGVKDPTRAKATTTTTTTAIKTPAALATALKKNKKAQKEFDAFTPGKRKEYNEWIADAKSDATRDRRIEQAIEWIAEGKSRNWKYQ